MTHDYKRNGTTTLFAALNVLTGEVLGQNMPRHPLPGRRIRRMLPRGGHQEFIRFLNRIKRDVPTGKTIHLVLDNYAAHKHEKVRAWLARHPRWTFHFTPTSCSWLNAVEGVRSGARTIGALRCSLAKLTRRRLKFGVFGSVVDLQTAINRFVAEHNQHEAKPFTWTAEPDKIIAARNRGFQTLESIP